MQQPGGSPQGRNPVEAAGGPGLPEVIQNSARNRFSGRLLVSQEGSEGVIFFRDGEVVHAEWGDRTGEEAFYEILQTPGAPYALEPKVTSAVRTIDRTWKALLLEAARLADERRRGQPRAPVPEAAREKLTALVEKIRHIPGVVHATLVYGRQRLPREGAIFGTIAALFSNLFLFIALSFLLVGANPRPGEAWLRLFVDLIASQIVIVIITPWFLALQSRAMELAQIHPETGRRLTL